MQQIVLYLLQIFSIMGRKYRETGKQKRHNEIFEAYLALIRREGDKATQFPKKYYYNLLCDRFSYSFNHMGRVVRGCLQRERDVTI